jgi:hypothetical protein
MAISFGYGEFERVDPNKRQSILEARRRFLDVLFEKKYRLFNDLMMLFDYEKLSKELIEYDRQSPGVISYHFLSQLADEETRNNVVALSGDTPVFHLLNFVSLRKKLPKYAWVNDKSFKARISKFNFEEELKSLIPEWTELKTIRAAEMFCSSLEKWAAKLNISDEWFMNFIVAFFRRLFYLLEYETLIYAKNYSEETMNEHRFYSFTYIYQDNVRDAIGKAKSDVCSPFFRFFSAFGDEEAYPSSEPFVYSSGGFVVKVERWCPYLSKRRKYISECEGILGQHIYNLKEKSGNYPIGESNGLKGFVERSRDNLIRYCDAVTKGIEDNKPLSELESFRFDGILAKVDEVWNPEVISRTKFIANTLSLLKAEVNNVETQLKGLNESFTKLSFNTTLIDYCNKTQQPYIDSDKWRKTPRKNSGILHFEWLVDYLVNSDRSFTSIASDYDVDLKTVREGIRETADLVGVTIRNSIRSGRPKGSQTKNSTGLIVK